MYQGNENKLIQSIRNDSFSLLFSTQQKIRALNTFMLILLLTNYE